MRGKKKQKQQKIKHSMVSILRKMTKKSNNKQDVLISKEKPENKL